MFIEICIGILLAVLMVFIIAKIYPQNDYAFWQFGLIIAACAYVFFAIFATSWAHLPIELGGVFLYGVFVYLSRKYTLFWLSIGWALHICWDIFLHLGTEMTYAPTWYPGICLGFDVVIAAYIFWLWKTKKHLNVS